VTVYFTLPSGEKKAAKAKIGDNLLDVILENNVEVEGFGKDCLSLVRCIEIIDVLLKRKITCKKHYT